MKAHIGIDSATKIIHSVMATSANVHDSHALADLLHGNEDRVWGDSAYQGQRDIIRAVLPDACDLPHRRYRVAGRVDSIEPRRNRIKSKTRARVEHAFLIGKRVFGFSKVRYRDLRKNRERLNAACALANLFQLRKVVLHSA